MPERPYTYYDFTLSLCPQYLRRIEAKIVFEDGNVFMLKRCPEHGRQKGRYSLAYWPWRGWGNASGPLPPTW